MKFTIAAGILAQTIPAISEKSSLSKRLSQDENQDVDPSRFFARRTKHRTSSHRALAANARRARFQARIHSGYQLANASFNSTAGMQCVPLSNDADIGILSCGPGYECAVDEQGSSLGGVCVPTSRELQGYRCYLCGIGFGLGSEHYEAVLDIPEAGYEGITGRDLKVAAYLSYTMDQSTCSVAREVVQAGGFCEPLCDLCGWGSNVPEGNFDVPVDVSVSGYDGATCGSLFLASYRYATVATRSCPVVAAAAKSSGCCSALWCDLCSFGEETSDTYFAGTTCGDLSFAAYSNKSISDDDCPAAVQLADAEGCCSPTPTYDDCNICGNATFYPDAQVYKYGTCGYVQSIFPAEDCAYYSFALTQTCCATRTGVSAPPTHAPQESTTIEPGAPSTAPQEDTAPTSKSTATWCTSTLVSLMGLSAATTAGALMLN